LHFAAFRRIRIHVEIKFIPPKLYKYLYLYFTM